MHFPVQWTQLLMLKYEKKAPLVIFPPPHFSLPTTGTTHFTKHFPEWHVYDYQQVVLQFDLLYVFFLQSFFYLCQKCVESFLVIEGVTEISVELRGATS